MPRFFVPNDNIANGRVEILGNDAHHISRALRMAIGEEIITCDMGGNEYLCKLETIVADRVFARIIEMRPSQTESPCKIRLYQAYPKGDKLDTIVQKAVELGVLSIIPFDSDRCVSRPDAKASERKRERWQRIAHEAAKQCGRGEIPLINPSLPFNKMLSEAILSDIPIFCYEGDGTESLPRIFSHYKEMPDKKDAPTISVVIGSEGGFSRAEAAAAASTGFFCASLGKRILRCETASAFALAAIAYEFEL